MLKLVIIIFTLLTLFPPPIEKIRFNIRVIIGLCIIIFVLQNIEGFGTGIDGEALRNIASLYNSSNGTLKVKNLEATGKIEATGDITTSGGNVTATGYGEFGNAYIGSYKATKGGNVGASFCNKKYKANPEGYSIMQHDSGGGNLY